jgi:hypothetical protein
LFTAMIASCLSNNARIRIFVPDQELTNRSWVLFQVRREGGCTLSEKGLAPSRWGLYLEAAFFFMLFNFCIVAFVPCRGAERGHVSAPWP